MIPSRHGIHDWLSHGNYLVPEEHPLRKESWFAGIDDSNIDYLAGMRCYTDELADEILNYFIVLELVVVL